MAKLNEDVKVCMLKGEKGEKGENGQGIPAGGKTGQAIIKASDNDYDYKWGSLVVNDVANATNDGNGNNIVNTYATKTELNTAKTDASKTYLAKSDASNIYVPRIDDCSHIPILNHEKPYMRLATLTIDHALEDAPIMFEIVGRTHFISTIQILFKSSGGSTDPALDKFVTDSYDGFYLYKSATSTWDLYYKEASAWGGVGIKSIFNGSTLQNIGVHINVNITHVDSIPSDAIQAVNPNLTKDKASETYATKAELANVANKIYPVGSIYMNVISTNPSTLFGGTWEQILGKFLLAAYDGGGYPAGSTGGEAQHKLTIEEMPNHGHGLTLVGDGIGGNPGRGIVGDYKNGSTNFCTDSNGLNYPHNNMPPYLAVYMWKRTA